MPDDVEAARVFGSANNESLREGANSRLDIKTGRRCRPPTRIALKAHHRLDVDAGRMACAPITISSKSGTEVMRHKLVVVVDKAGFDLRRHAMPVTIDSGGEIDFSCSGAAQSVLANSGRTRFDVARRHGSSGTKDFGDLGNR